MKLGGPGGGPGANKWKAGGAFEARAPSIARLSIGGNSPPVDVDFVLTISAIKLADFGRLASLGPVSSCASTGTGGEPFEGGGPGKPISGGKPIGP